MGPLTGIRVVEIAGIGPGPFCAMMLADMGADVIRVDRSSAVRGGDAADPPKDLLNRGRRSLGVDLKSPDGVAVVMSLVSAADAMLEGFRPGVAERLGIGPGDCLERNPRLVYGRITGWGQEGPYASAAGHDLNYIALAGALHSIGREGDAPVPPLNLVGDFGGGGMYLAFGMVCALLEARSSGRGQVVDAAMVDGAASLMTAFHGLAAAGYWSERRGANMLDTGAHFYNVYETADAEYITLGPIEPQFYDELRRLLGLNGSEWDQQTDSSAWPELKKKLAAVVAQRTRAEWCELLEGTDCCFAPVLSLSEAPEHAHNVARGTFGEVAGQVQPNPAPRFSRTPGSIRRPPPHAGQHTDEILREAGFDSGDIASLRASGAVA
ncbi:MAG: CaiB/BaiF CoA-transferase family protein [Acidimicrobiaceae bacterium]|nr:CaiB/BaiF CoA-transferase family protein [Acidimicrobiaceae bacterium]MCY4176688.1 CaiB/BaiF CoA-transferase family protein [Acidimicrobiaceae bacterium]MCY4281237.1 CaiB/BaiF CoA-transferase family protein [Acidimicrobiaceae bacterium]MCY4294265.1 CaiB/BaiF CoA-transferase family protein [Acidimicrobiaceae bacterium]